MTISTDYPTVEWYRGNWSTFDDKKIQKINTTYISIGNYTKLNFNSSDFSMNVFNLY